MEVHYYECHVTVEPCVEEERLLLLKKVCKGHQFRVADLLLVKRKVETAARSNKDSFCTTRASTLSETQRRLNALVEILNNNGFKVWRAKIEAVIYDEKFDK